MPRLISLDNNPVRAALSLALMLGLLWAPAWAEEQTQQFPVTNRTDDSPINPTVLNTEEAGDDWLPDSNFDGDPPAPVPPQLKQMQEATRGAEPKNDDKDALHIRDDAQYEAALSYGARGGLAWRTFEIQRRLAEQENYLGRIFDFKRLLINSQSGLLIEPPIVTEAEQAVIVGASGQEAAVADKVYRINQGAKIVTAPRNWRLYLERDWGTVDPPPKLLLPKNAGERARWRVWVKEGWDAGVAQADDIYQADLDRMNHDFVGMVRYRELLAQGMISAPFALAENRGITGGGSEMRVGDRGLTITGQPELIPQGQTWNPRPR